MKKNNLLILLLFISNILIGQNHRFIYEYSFKMDSLSRENSAKELMNLDVSKNGSLFYSNEKFVYDSLVNAELKKAEAIHSTNIDFSKFILFRCEIMMLM